MWLVCRCDVVLGRSKMQKRKSNAVSWTRATIELVFVRTHSTWEYPILYTLHEQCSHILLSRLRLPRLVKVAPVLMARKSHYTTTTAISAYFTELHSHVSYRHRHGTYMKATRTCLVVSKATRQPSDNRKHRQRRYKAVISILYTVTKPTSVRNPASWKISRLSVVTVSRQAELFARLYAGMKIRFVRRLWRWCIVLNGDTRLQRTANRTSSDPLTRRR